MANIDLSKYGITGATEIVYNPSYEDLYKEETNPALEGYEKGQESELGAVNVMTGIYTGRSPKDKYIVMDENSKDTVWWTSDEYKNDNHPASQEAWKAVKELAVKEGDVVETGQLLGYISEPTKYYCKEGSNLFFEMKKDGEPVDPFLYLE